MEDTLELGVPDQPHETFETDETQLPQKNAEETLQTLQMERRCGSTEKEKRERQETPWQRGCEAKKRQV
jgi:hypothetical protein